MQKKSKRILIIVLAAICVCAAAVGISIKLEHDKYFCQYATAFSFSEVENGENISLVSHRGLATEAPENTLPAYIKAAEKGFEYAETDIRATADGVWVLSHDASLKRMTGFNGKVEQLSAEEVLSHRIIKGANAEEYPDLRTPTFEQFLQTCKAIGIKPVIEIKTKPEEYPSAPFKDILALLEKYDMKNDAIIISFYYDALEIIREYDSKIKLQYLVKELDEQTLTKADKLGSCGIDCEYKALLKSEDMLKIAKGSGIELGAWTVDSPKAAMKIAQAGVDYITTNAAMP